MPDADSNRKRSRSPSDSEAGKHYKRANTGAAAPDDSTSPTTDQAQLPSGHDVTMADTLAKAESSLSPKYESANDGKILDASPDDDEAAKDSATTTGAPSPSTTAAPAPSAMIHMRCLIVTQDASIIIGKGGSHVNEIREKSGARVMVSESIPGNPERILNVSGPLDAVSKVCSKASISRHALIFRRHLASSYDASMTSHSTYLLFPAVERLP